jgi:hypothetical protein
MGERVEAAYQAMGLRRSARARPMFAGAPAPQSRARRIDAEGAARLEPTAR